MESRIFVAEAVRLWAEHFVAEVAKTLERLYGNRCFATSGVHPSIASAGLRVRIESVRKFTNLEHTVADAWPSVVIVDFTDVTSSRFARAGQL